MKRSTVWLMLGGGVLWLGVCGALGKAVDSANKVTRVEAPAGPAPVASAAPFVASNLTRAIDSALHDPSSLTLTGTDKNGVRIDYYTYQVAGCPMGFMLGIVKKDPREWHAVEVSDANCNAAAIGKSTPVIGQGYRTWFVVDEGPLEGMLFARDTDPGSPKETQFLMGSDGYWAGYSSVSDEVKQWVLAHASERASIRARLAAVARPAPVATPPSKAAAGAKAAKVVPVAAPAPTATQPQDFQDDPYR